MIVNHLLPYIKQSCRPSSICTVCTTNNTTKNLENTSKLHCYILYTLVLMYRCLSLADITIYLLSKKH